jgi:hypothetical protein
MAGAARCGSSRQLSREKSGGLPEGIDMTVRGAALVLALAGLAAACSGGGPSAPTATAASNVAEPAETTPQETTPEATIPQGVPALPGLVGYDVPEATARAPLALAAESVDLTWAEATEAIILAEIADVTDAPITVVAVECRTTWCGVVIDLPFVDDGEVRSAIRDRLQEVFEVNGAATHIIFRLDGTSWFTVFIEIRRLV